MVLKMKMRNLVKKCFEGDLTMPKALFWLIGVTCMLAGIVYGLCAAPFTHGVTIGNNNGNYDRCMWEIDEGNREDEEA